MHEDVQEAIALFPVSSELFSPRFPKAQTFEHFQDGEYVSDALTSTWLKFQLKTRLYDNPNCGMHRSLMVIAQTGKGKNHFVHYVVRPTAHQQGIKALYLCNRKALGLQQIQEAMKVADPMCPLTGIPTDCSDFTVGSLRLLTYHKYFNLLKKYGQAQFSGYKIIIADEAHFFTADAEFNADTYEILQSLPKVFSHALRIYMTATPRDVFDPIYCSEWNCTEGEFAPNQCKAFCDSNGGYLTNKEALPVLDVFRFAYDYSAYCNILVFSRNDNLAETILQSDKSEKWIVFVTSKNNGKSLKNAITNSGVSAEYIDSESKNSRDIQERQRWERLFETDQKIHCRVLITTSVLDNGFSIKDPQLRNVVIYSDDETEFLQELGRVRLTKDQTINLFFPRLSKDFFDRSKAILHNFCLFDGSDSTPEYSPYAEIYPRRILMIKNIIRSDNSIGYLTSNTIETLAGPAEIPRINYLAKWKAFCIMRDQRKYEALLRVDPENATVSYKTKWLEGDVNHALTIRDMNVPYEEEAARTIENFISKYIDAPLIEGEKGFEDFSREFQRIIAHAIPDERKRINNGKKRGAWKHLAIKRRLERIQRDSGRDTILSNYLTRLYTFEKEGDAWMIKAKYKTSERRDVYD